VSQPSEEFKTVAEYRFSVLNVGRIVNGLEATLPDVVFYKHNEEINA
jgi:hypothetical protein